MSTWVQSSAPITLGKPDGDDERNANTSASSLLYIIGYCKCHILYNSTENLFDLLSVFLAREGEEDVQEMLQSKGYTPYFPANTCLGQTFSIPYTV